MLVIGFSLMLTCISSKRRPSSVQLLIRKSSKIIFLLLSFSLPPPRLFYPISELVFIFPDSYSLFLSSPRDLYNDISLSFSRWEIGKENKATTTVLSFFDVSLNQSAAGRWMLEMSLFRTNNWVIVMMVVKMSINCQHRIYNIQQ